MPAPKGHKCYATPEQQTGRPEEWTEERINKEAYELLLWANKPDNLYINRFALERKYNPDLFHKFAEKNKNFRSALSIAKKQQELKIVEGATYGQMKEGFVKFVLTNNHNWRDTQHIESKVDTTINIKPTRYAEIDIATQEQIESKADDS